jgi:hypothetical protein
MAVRNKSQIMGATMKRHIFFSATIFICLGLLAAGVRSQNEKPHFGTIGEGYTAADISQGIDIGWRMFTAPNMGAICAAAGKAARLITDKIEYVLMVGDTFSFNDLCIVAVDAAGKTLKPTPVTMEIKEEPSDLIDILNYKKDGGGAEVHALRPGTFRIRFRTLCTGPDKTEKEIIIKFTILTKK